MPDAAFVRAAGEALFGERFIAPLAASLEPPVTVRTVRFWLDSERPVPPGRLAQMRALLTARRDAIDLLLEQRAADAAA